MFSRSSESWTRDDRGISYQDYSWTVSGGNDTIVDNTVSYSAQLRMEDWQGKKYSVILINCPSIIIETYGVG